MQSGSLGRVWYGPQTQKGAAASTLYSYVGQMFDLSPQQMMRNIGALVGGSLLPGKSIKTAAYSAGAGVMPPCLVNNIGWLFYAFAGTCSSTDNTDGSYTHKFPAEADENAPGKYLTGGRKVPGTVVLYEQMEDLVPVRLRLDIAPGEYTNMRFETIGRTISAPTSPSWTFTAEDTATTPIACNGGVKFDEGANMTGISGVSIDLVNVVPDLRRVLTVGSYYPHDFPVMARALTVTLSQLWDSATFYKTFFYDGTGAWTPVVKNAELDVYVQTAGVMPTQATDPYELRFWADSMDWEVSTPPTLVGGELISFGLTGTATYSTDDIKDWHIALTNEQASYGWPEP